MLDLLLLLRADDLALWQDADIRYVVVDEFHTYDGAQGTDAAMLLRRLAKATGHSEPGRPLGGICPVATSATLGDNSDQARIRAVANDVFGTEFGEDSVITEQRQPASGFLGDIDYTLPLPAPRDLQRPFGGVVRARGLVAPGRVLVETAMPDALLALDGLRVRHGMPPYLP